MTIERHPDRSQWRDLSLLCVVAIASDLSYGGLTPLLVAYERLLHFDLTTSGWLATAEGVGFTGGALIVAVFGNAMRPTHWRVAAVLMLLASAQILSAFTVNPWGLAAWRLLSGTAAGLTYAMGLSAIAAGRNPDRGFAVYFGAVFVSGLIALALIPRILQWGGLRGFYLSYAGILTLCIVFIRWYPLKSTHPPAWGSASAQADNRDRRWGSQLLLAALFLNFVFNGGMWVLAEHFGLEIRDTDPESLGALLAGTMIFGLVGTGLATLVAKRWSHLCSIVVGNAGLIAAAFIMTMWHTVVALVVAMALLNAAVTILTPATLSALAAKNSLGAQWGNLATQAGYSAGPAASAAIAAQSGISGLVAFAVAGFVASILLSWLALASLPAKWLANTLK